MIKMQKDLEKGDIIKVEFGDYDNVVTVIIDKVEEREYGWSKIECRYLNDNKPEIMYGKSDELLEVLGKEEV